MNFLACDLGGTKVLLGIFEKEKNNNSPKLIFKKKYISSDWDSFDLMLEDFLEKECKRISVIVDILLLEHNSNCATSLVAIKRLQPYCAFLL